MTKALAICLAEDDNVGVATTNLRAGIDVHVGDQLLSAKDAIPFGHKIALKPIAGGEQVIKFGVPIGRAKIAIEVGEHVHVHNIESDYINNAVDHFEA